MAQSKSKRPSTDGNSALTPLKEFDPMAEEILFVPRLQARHAVTEPTDDFWGWASFIYYVWERTRSKLVSGVTDYYRLSALTNSDLEELESKRSPVVDYTRTVPGLKPGDRLFAELANLAQISSAEGIEGLRRGVLYELSHYWVVRIAPAPPVAADSKQRAFAQLREAAKLSQDLSTIASNFDKQASWALVDAQARNRRPDFSDYRTQLKIIAEFAKLSSEALICFPECKPKSQGRPRRVLLSYYKGPKPLPDFTLNLLLDVRAAGGQLTFDKNSGTGTLVEALALLRPYVRPGIIPNKLPSTLARIKTLDTKIATATWNIPSK
jgi:hypothetical protein